MRRFIVIGLSILATIVITDESSSHNVVKRQAVNNRGSRQLFPRYRSRQFPQPEEEEEFEGALPSADYIDPNYNLSPALPTSSSDARRTRFRNRQQSSLDEDPYVYVPQEALPRTTTTTTTIAPPTPPPAQSSLNTRRSFPRFAARPKLFSPLQTPEPVAESSIPAPSPPSQQPSPYSGSSKRIYSRPRGSFRAAQSENNDYYQDEDAQPPAPPVTQYQPYSPPNRQTPAPRRPPPSFRARPSRQDDRDSSNINQAASVPPRATSPPPPPPNRRQQGRRGRPRARARARTTTTTTTTTTTEEPDYYYYDDEYAHEGDGDYALPPTTTTTTTKAPPPKKPSGRRYGQQRGNRRGGASSTPKSVIKFDPESQFLPPPEDVIEPLPEVQNRRYTTSSTTTTTTTPRPPARTLKPRTDGRIIDFLGDPNYPRELTGVDLTNYPFYITVPENINFECDGRHDGYYASVPLFCQVFHYCFAGARYDFLCPNYTLYDQLTFTCRFVNNVNCANSEQYYNRNDMLYVETTTLSAKEQKAEKKAKKEKKKEEEEDDDDD